MSFKQRVNSLIISIFVIFAILIAILFGFSYHLVNKTAEAYQEGEKLTNTVNVAREAHVNFQRQVQEWKNILIRGSDKALYDKHFAGFEQREKLMDEQLTTLSQTLEAQGMTDTATKVNATLKEHAVLGQKYRAALQANPTLDWQGQQNVDVMVRGIDRPTSQGMDDLVSEIEQKVSVSFDNKSAQIKADTYKSLVIIGLLTLVAIIALIYLLTKLMKDLTNTLGDEPEKAVAATARIAQGDLSEKLNAKSPTSLIGSLEMMQLRLRNINLAISASANELKENTMMLSNAKERETLLHHVQKLQHAIERIKIERRE